MAQSQGRRRRHHRRIQSLVDTLLGTNPASPPDLWLLQLDLLQLQRQIQADISAEKRRPPAERDHDALRTYQQARWHARRLGDALAWVLLRDQRIIESLSRNSRVPVNEQGHSAVGALRTVEVLAERGWGFPLLHDITDVLRIGDASFVRRGHDPEVVTVEIKTQVIAESAPDSEGRITGEYRSTAITVAPVDDMGNPLTVVGDDPTTVTLSHGSAGSAVPTSGGHLHGRVTRQTERMRRAFIMGSTTADGPVEGLEEPTLNVSVNSKPSENWKMLRRVIRQAHRTGYGSEVVDKAFMYCVFYDNGGADSIAAYDSSIAEDVTGSALLDSEPRTNRQAVASARRTTTRSGWRS